MRCGVDEVVMRCSEVGIAPPNRTTSQDSRASQITFHEMLFPRTSLFWETGGTQTRSVVTSTRLYAVILFRGVALMFIAFAPINRYFIFFRSVLAFSSFFRHVWCYDLICALWTKCNGIVEATKVYPFDRVENKRVKRLTWLTNLETLVLLIILGLNPRFAGVLGGFARPYGVRSARTGVNFRFSIYCTLVQIFNTCVTN